MTTHHGTPYLSMGFVRRCLVTSSSDNIRIHCHLPQVPQLSVVDLTHNRAVTLGCAVREFHPLNFYLELSYFLMQMLDFLLDLPDFFIQRSTSR